MKQSRKILYLSNMLKRRATSVKMAKMAAVSIGCGLAFVACSESQVAGGGSSGSEAGNAITAQIWTADEKPAALAKVKLIESESIDVKDAIDAKTDKDGKLVIEGVADGNYTLEASLDGNALQLNVNVKDDKAELGTNKLGKTAKVSGTVKGPGIVKVRGLDHSAKVVDGSFDIDSLPAGPISLVFVPEKGDTSSTYLKIVEGAKAQASTFADESVYLLLDDFQDSNYQNRFMPAHTYDGGWWYLSYAEKNVTPVVMSTNSVGGTTPALDEEDGNIFAHAAVKFGDAFTSSSGDKQWPWASIGVELGMSNKELYCNDISSVESISFKARGSGNIIFTMIDETKEEGKREIMAFKFSPSSEWDTYNVSIKDLIFPDYTLKCVNQLLWKLSSPAVPATEDEPNPTIDLQLDDIKLVGGDRLSIWKR